MTMGLRTSQIIDLLKEKPGRVIEHDAGKYVMNEPNGSVVIAKDADGRSFEVRPLNEQIDTLLDDGLLIVRADKKLVAK